jgi:hypothetical protein
LSSYEHNPPTATMRREVDHTFPALGAALPLHSAEGRTH